MREIVLNLGYWDIVLIVVLVIKGTLAAYISNPKWKSFFLLLPVPFTFAVLALGQPINTTHVAGLLVLLAYTFMVKFLNRSLKVPIVWAILISALTYCVTSGILVFILPKTDNTFLAVCVSVCLLASMLHYNLEHPIEPGAKSTLAIWKKVLVLTFVLMFVVLIKSLLQGFMTVFPMLGVIIAYEARLSLYTVCRHIPIFMLNMAAMMSTCFILQGSIGLIPALLISWIIYLAILPFLLLPMWEKYDSQSKF